MRALVTGATGFVGAAVARALLREGWQVRALARKGSDRRNLQSIAVEVVAGDLADAASLQHALAGCEGLFHVAADYRLGAFDPQQLYKTNVEGTRNILHAARAAGVRRVVYTSSVATIGIPKDGSPGTEASPSTLADMIGTTRSRVSFFMNRFRKLGFISYDGRIQVHKSLLNVVLLDQLPEHNAQKPPIVLPEFILKPKAPKVRTARRKKL